MLDGQWNGFGVYYYETGHANFGLWEDGNSVDAQSVFILARVSRALRQRRRAQRRRRRPRPLAENAELRALLATLVPLSGRYTVKPPGTGLRPAPENKGTADLVPGGGGGDNCHGNRPNRELVTDRT